MTFFGNGSSNAGPGLKVAFSMAGIFTTISGKKTPERPRLKFIEGSSVALFFTAS